MKVATDSFFKNTIRGADQEWQFAVDIMKLFGHDPNDGEMAAQIVALAHVHMREAQK